MAERRPTGTQVLDRLFVYGTMRQGQTARSLIANQIARSALATTRGAIFAFPMGYPGFVDDTAPSFGGAAVEGDGRVFGEVIWLTELAATFALLDAYEGADFTRIVRPIELSNGEITTAWLYALADPAAARLGVQIPHGDWVRYWTEQS
jgi:gamma-glutamylcyclotransferase (GGCT)/AIG2-like uncharacterized protein YtfP